MTTTILGVFDDPAAARRAMESLRDSPLELDDISIISRATESGEPVSSGDDISAGEGAAVGAVWGGLVGLATLLIPGIGPFVAGGALFAALTGAATGAVVGGIAGALIDTGLSEDEAQMYEGMVREGKTLVAVKARDEDALQVRRILVESGANTLRENDINVSQSADVHMYNESGQRLAQDDDATLPRPAPGPRSVDAAGPRGVYTSPETTTPYDERAVDEPTQRTAGTEHTWTGSQWVGEGQGRHGDTGTFDADQWAGQDQQPGTTPGDTWTSGEWVGEGQGQGPRDDTGAHDARQWVGEGQGQDATEANLPPRRSDLPAAPGPDTNIPDPNLEIDRARSERRL